MWILSSKPTPTNTESRQIVLVNKEYSIGRFKCDIAITEDLTVSRKHAILTVDQSATTKVRLTDVSKFGTWINSHRLSGSTELNDGDEIQFGSPESTFKLSREPFLICSSCLDSQSKTSMKSLLHKLDGQLVNDWQMDCRYLVMTNLSVTIKVVGALISQKFIVTVQYLEDLFQAWSSKTELPDPERYLPTLAELQLNPNEVSFNPNPERQTLFISFTFYFLNSKQHKKLCHIIELGGGRAHLLEGDNLPTLSTFSSPRSLVMQCEVTEISRNIQSYASDVRRHLQSNGKRFIADSEIGYAILFCSTSRHCNPDIQPGAKVFAELPSQTLSLPPQTEPSQVLVENTEQTQYRSEVQATQVPEKATKHSGTVRSAYTHNPTVSTTETSSSTHAPNPTVSAIDNPPVLPVIKDEPLSCTAFTDAHSELLFASALSHGHENPAPTHVKSEPLSCSADSMENNPSGRVKRTDLVEEDRGNVSVWDDGTVMPRRSRRNQAVCDVGSAGRDVSGVVGGPKTPLTHDVTRCLPAAVQEPDVLSHSKRRLDKPPEATPHNLSKRQKKIATDLSDKRYMAIDEQLDVTSRRDHTKPALSSKEHQSARHLTKPIPASHEHQQQDLPATVLKYEEDQMLDLNKTDGHPSWARGSNKKNVNIYTQETDDKPHVAMVTYEGFINTSLIAENKVQACKRYEKSHDLPVSLIRSLFSDLVYRPVQRTSRVSKEDVREDGMVMWNGKLVQNYKSFKKSMYKGANQLPNIIGGRDLFLHINSKNEKIDEMFNAELEAENQRSQGSLHVDAMFDLSLQKKPKSRR